MKCKGILICVPAMGQMMCARTAETLFSVAQLLTKRGIPNRLSWYSAADIEDVRNLFVSVWYDGHPQFSHMLFVDADMGFDPELIEDMLHFDKPLMGVLYARRSQDVSIVGTLPEGHGMKDVVKGFMKSNGLGTGVMMISREVIDTLLKAYPEMSDVVPSVLSNTTPFELKRIIRAFDKVREPNVRLSEDMSFCYRYVNAGGEIWANVNYKISHVGPFDYAMRYQGIMERREAENRNAA
jgi:hypothetical protein